MKSHSEPGVDVEMSMVDKKRAGLTKASSSRGSRKQSMFGAFSFSNSTVSNSADDMSVSKMDAARITAPFVMGQTTQQTMNCICINKSGLTTDKMIVKHTFAKQIGVHIRDLRIIEKSPANRVEAAINPRTNCIIVAIENIKLVIFRTEVYVFCPDEEMVPKFVSLLQSNIANHSHSSGHHFDDEDDESDHSRASSNGIVMSRFEHLVLESMFSCACSAINDAVISLSADLNETFQALQSHAQQNADHDDHKTFRTKQTKKIKDMIRKSEMSPIKTKLQKLRKKSSEISRVLLVLLEDEEIFSRLFLNNLAFSLDSPHNRAQSRNSFELGGTGALRKSFGSALAKLRNDFNASNQNGSFPSMDDDVEDSSSGRGGAHHSRSHSTEHNVKSVRLDDFNIGSNPMHQAAPYIPPTNPVTSREREISGNNSNSDVPFRGGGGAKKKRGSVIQTMVLSSDRTASTDNSSNNVAASSMPFSANRGALPKRVSITIDKSQLPQSQQMTAIISLEDVQNLELILDNFISQFNWISSEIDDLLDQLINAEVNAALQLDIVRNRIMRYTVYLSMLATAISLAALVTGIFGMNLEFPSALYDTLDPFKLTVSMITISIPIVFLILFYAGNRRGIF